VRNKRQLQPIALLAVCVAIGAIGTATPAVCQTSTLSGQAVTPGSDGESFAVAGVAATLTSVSEDLSEDTKRPTAETDELGVFRFRDVAEGCYLVSGEAEGLTGQSDVFCVPLGEGEKLTLEMNVEVVVESVEVTATSVGIDPTETSNTGSVGASTLADAPKANKRYEDVLPLIPGVLKGRSGEINLNGARAAQAGSQFNGVDVTDPVSGSSQFNVPLEAVSSVQVLSNPYDAQYGGFAGAIATVDTKPANFSDFKFSLQNFGPRVRRRNGSISGIESFTPRLTMTGPIKKGKLAFLASTEYQFVRADQEDANLPLLERDVEREALNAFVEVEALHTDRNRTTFGMLVFPEKQNFFGLDAFTVQPSTPDLRRRGYLTTVRNHHDFASGASLVSRLSYQDLVNVVSPRGSGDYLVGLEKASGSFFYRQDRRSIRRRLTEQYNVASVSGLGTHQFRTGFTLAAETYDGQQTNSPIDWLGAADLSVLRSTFSPAGSLNASKREAAGYIQDKWSVSSSLTLDLGVRLERDSIASRMNPAYRAGFAYAVGGSARTVLRGGAGLFYDGISLIVPTFTQLPSRTETFFGLGGLPTESISYTNRIGGPLRNARSLGWSLQLERELVRDLFVRAGYQQRRTTNNFLITSEPGQVEPGVTDRNGFFTLSNDGRDNYREWQFTARYRLPSSGHFTASYVRSSSVGDLNDLGSIFGPTPAALIRANSRAPLRFDVPDRFLVWSEFGLPFGFRAVPVFELRSGFPYSAVDETRNFVGARNRAGRFPVYQSADLQITKLIGFNFRGKEQKIRVGLRMFNLLNNFNPQDVQSNIASPYYGTFYRGVKRKIRMVFQFGG